MGAVIVNNSRKNRAGRYVRQATGYSAFIPETLPPDPPVTMDQQLWTLLSEADRALGRLDGSTDSLPNPDLFVFMYVRQEAVLSSQIEGTQASLADILEAEAAAARPDAPRDVDEVINYINAMNYGLRRVHELPVSQRLIREIHERLLAGVRGDHLSPGEFRRTQNWIGAPGCTLANAKFVPPPPDQVPYHLGALEDFLHSADEMPVLIKVGLAHAQFETIHPFLDGNGRVGRLLITFLLCERKVLLRPLLYLSHFFRKYRDEYYDHLQRVRDHGDWEGWLKFFLRGVAAVSTEATHNAREIVNLRLKHSELVRNHFGRGAASALQVLEALYMHPYVYVKNVAELAGVQFPRANKIVGDFVKLGILEEVSGRARNRIYRYAPYVKMFSPAVPSAA